MSCCKKREANEFEQLSLCITLIFVIEFEQLFFCLNSWRERQAGHSRYFNIENHSLHFYYFINRIIQVHVIIGIEAKQWVVIHI